MKTYTAEKFAQQQLKVIAASKKKMAKEIKEIKEIEAAGVYAHGTVRLDLDRHVYQAAIETIESENEESFEEGNLTEELLELLGKCICETIAEIHHSL